MTAVGASRFGSTALAKHRVAFLGDSITAFAINNSGNAKQWTNYGYVTWVRWACGQRFYTDQSLVLGVASQGTAHVLSTQVPATITARAQVAVIHIGVNDIGVLTLAQMIDNMEDILTLLNNAGILVVIVPIAPTNSNGAPGSGLSAAAKQQQIAAFNQWCWIQAQKYSRAVQYADIWPTMVDYSTGYALAAYLVDGLHDNVASASVKATAVAAALNALIPAQQGSPYHSILDTFDATLAPQGNLIGAKGFFAGTGGSLKNSGTGNVATGWTFGPNTASTITAAMSKGTDAAASSMATQVIAIGGTADSNFVEGDTGSITTTGLSVGDYVYAEAEVSWTGLANVVSIYNYLTCLDGSAALYESYDGADATGKGNMPAAGSAVFRTEAFALPTGFQTMRHRVRLRGASSGTPAGTITWKRATVRKASLDGLNGL